MHSFLSKSILVLFSKKNVTNILSFLKKSAIFRVSSPQSFQNTRLYLVGELKAY